MNEQVTNNQDNQNSTTSSSNTEYLAQLLKDKKQISSFPNIFIHLDRLLDNEISRTRAILLNSNVSAKSEPLILPEPQGPKITLSDKIYVPVKDYPEFNFIGRILGPRGMTAKYLEQETGCKIMIRGKGSMRDKKKEEQNKGRPNWEHLDDELHVLITVEDTEERAALRMKKAKEEIERLLIPAAEGEDELKKMQLMELAILNGTFRDPNSKGNSLSMSPGLNGNNYVFGAHPSAAIFSQNGGIAGLLSVSPPPPPMGSVGTYPQGLTHIVIPSVSAGGSNGMTTLNNYAIAMPAPQSAVGTAGGYVILSTSPQQRYHQPMGNAGSNGQSGLNGQTAFAHYNPHTHQLEYHLMPAQQQVQQTYYETAGPVCCYEQESAVVAPDNCSSTPHLSNAPEQQQHLDNNTNTTQLLNRTPSSSFKESPITLNNLVDTSNLVTSSLESHNKRYPIEDPTTPKTPVRASNRILKNTLNSTPKHHQQQYYQQHHVNNGSAVPTVGTYVSPFPSLSPFMTAPGTVSNSPPLPSFLENGATVIYYDPTTQQYHPQIAHLTAPGMYNHQTPSHQLFNPNSNIASSTHLPTSHHQVRPDGAIEYSLGSYETANLASYGAIKKNLVVSQRNHPYKSHN